MRPQNILQPRSSTPTRQTGNRYRDGVELSIIILRTRHEEAKTLAKFSSPRMLPRVPRIMKPVYRSGVASTNVSFALSRRHSKLSSIPHRPSGSAQGTVRPNLLLAPWSIAQSLACRADPTFRESGHSLATTVSLRSSPQESGDTYHISSRMGNRSCHTVCWYSLTQLTQDVVGR